MTVRLKPDTTGMAAKAGDDQGWLLKPDTTGMAAKPDTTTALSSRCARTFDNGSPKSKSTTRRCATAPRARASRFPSPTSCASPSGSTASACTTSKAAGPARTRRTSSSSTRRSAARFTHAQARRVRLDAAQGRRAPTTTIRCGCCVDAETPVVTIFGKTWLLHVREVLQTTPEENLAMIEDTVRFLKQHGRFVVYDAEHAFDGYKDDRAVRAGDLAGRRARRRRHRRAVRHQRRIAAGRDRRRSRARRARALGGRIGIHTHDDIGLGVANALAAHRRRRDATCRARSTATASAPATAT